MTRARRALVQRHGLWVATASAALALGLPFGEAASPVRGLAAGCGCGLALFVLLARRRPRLPAGRSQAVRSAHLSIRAAHEEALWRGALLLLLAPLLGRGPAAATGTAAFALAHVPSQGPRATVHLLTGGAFSALALGPGLLAAMAAHASYNTLVGTGVESPRSRPFRTVTRSATPAYARRTTTATVESVEESGEARLRLEGVVRRFGAVVAVDDLTLTLSPGEIVGLLGPNGAGKSTAISIAVGVRRPDSGRAVLFGLDPRIARARSRLGVAPQEAAFPPSVRVRELVDLVRSHFAAPEDPYRLLGEFGLSAVSQRLAGGLSGGERRRLALALAFAGRPQVLVLDEPSAGLDVESRRAAWDSVRAFRESGGSVLLTTHHLEEAEALANRIVVLDHGRIRAAGTARELRERAGLARITLRIERLPELPGATRVELREGTYVLHTAEPELVLSTIVASGIPFDELEVLQPSLEEAFLALTGPAS